MTITHRCPSCGRTVIQDELFGAAFLILLCPFCLREMDVDTVDYGGPLKVVHE